MSKVLVFPGGAAYAGKKVPAQPMCGSRRANGQASMWVEYGHLR